MAVASRGTTGTPDQERRAEWLELASRAIQADRAARAERAARLRVKDEERPEAGRSRLSGRMVLMEHAIGARNLARVEASTRTHPAVRAVNRPAARTETRTPSAARVQTRPAARLGPAAYLVLLVLGSLYGLAMAAVTAVAIARYATTDPLGAIGPVAFVGVAVGFAGLTALILPSARRARSSRHE